MKRNINSIDKGNPTQSTINEIYEVIQKSDTPMSITAIATKSGKILYATRKAIEFLKSFGIVKTLISSGNQTIVIINKEKNVTAN